MARLQKKERPLELLPVEPRRDEAERGGGDHRRDAPGENDDDQVRRARAELAVRVRFAPREVVAERVAIVGAPPGHLQGDFHVERAQLLGTPAAQGPRVERASDEQGRLGVRPPRSEEGVHGGRAQGRDLKGGTESARRGRHRRGGPHRRGVEGATRPVSNGHAV